MLWGRLRTLNEHYFIYCKLSHIQPTSQTNMWQGLITQNCVCKVQVNTHTQRMHVMPHHSLNSACIYEAAVPAGSKHYQSRGQTVRRATKPVGRRSGFCSRVRWTFITCYLKPPCPKVNIIPGNWSQQALFWKSNQTLHVYHGYCNENPSCLWSEKTSFGGLCHRPADRCPIILHHYHTGFIFNINSLILAVSTCPF